MRKMTRKRTGRGRGSGGGMTRGLGSTRGWPVDWWESVMMKGLCDTKVDLDLIKCSDM